MWLQQIRQLIYPPRPMCALCQKRPIPEGLPGCDLCLASLNLNLRQLQVPGYTCFAISTYYGSVKEWLNQIKYHSHYQAAVVFGEILGLAAQAIKAFYSVDYLMPVPLHTQRLKERGYNQAAVFATGMTHVWKRPIYQAVRIRNTVPQNDLTPLQRMRNLTGSFVIPHPEQIKGKYVLIVDDIYTTGTTFKVLANVLALHQAQPLGLFFAQSKSEI